MPPSRPPERVRDVEARHALELKWSFLRQGSLVEEDGLKILVHSYIREMDSIGISLKWVCKLSEHN